RPARPARRGGGAAAATGTRPLDPDVGRRGGATRGPLRRRARRVRPPHRVSAMRVLWLTPELPYWPGGSGGSTRQHQLIAQLIARGHQVHVAAPIHPDQREGAARLRAAGATLHGVERPPSRVREVLAAVRARPSL